MTMLMLGRRCYGDYHSIDDMMTASEAWHSLEPDRLLNDEYSLRQAFVRLDLDGNGKIDASELRVALMKNQGLPPAGFPQYILDAQVDAMISFADLDEDGMISFAEYKKIIKAGCDPRGGRILEREKKHAQRRGPPPPDVDDSQPSVIFL